MLSPRRRPGPGRALAACLSAALVLSAGCGGDETDADGGGPASIDLAALAAELPADVREISAADFDRLRADAGLPPDYDLTADRRDAAEPSAIGSLALGLLPQTQAYLGPDPDDPLLAAIDGTLIGAAATTRRPTTVAVIATDQPFDEISGELVNAGFAERDGALVDESDATPFAGAVADLGEGRIVVAQETKAATELMSGSGEPQLAALLDRVEEPVRLARLADGSSERCLRAVVAGEDPEAGGGVLEILGVEETPEADRVRTSVELEAGSAQDGGGEVLAIPYSVASTAGDPAGGSLAVQGLALGVGYECRGAGGGPRGGEPLTLGE